MTTDNAPSNARKAPSVHVLRARKLLYGGLVGGVAGSIVCLVVFGLVSGTRGLGSAALAALMVLVFYAGGQLVMVAFADAGARILLLVAMSSYTARVALLGLILLIFNANRNRWTGIDPLAVFITTIGVVVGWLIVEVWVFTRLRINVYDTEYVDPIDSSSATDTKSADGSEERRAEVSPGGGETR